MRKGVGERGGEEGGGGERGRGRIREVEWREGMRKGDGGEVEGVRGGEGGAGRKKGVGRNKLGGGEEGRIGGEGAKGAEAPPSKLMRCITYILLAAFE